ncbi:MAG: cation:proton antiporter [Deltaproteobacteria bacterium]|nr:cation:proton antiporter [Deltaproteobacteria bacterium]
MGFLNELLVLLAVATGGVALFERLRLPAIAGFLVMGALVGPGGIGLIGDPERVREIADLGVVFLLFEIGLELPLGRLRLMWRPALVSGGLQVGGTLVLVSSTAMALGLDWRNAVVLGALGGCCRSVAKFTRRRGSCRSASCCSRISASYHFCCSSRFWPTIAVAAPMA